MTQTPTDTDADMQRADEPERHVGFTGTRHGMTVVQAEKVSELIQRYDWLLHGDCWGADSHAHDIGLFRGCKIEIHPPSDPMKRAHRNGNVTRHPKPYLVRNHDIVDVAERLIAAPGQMTEQLRSGTWSTIRYAKRVGKPVTIVFPDGSVRDIPAVLRARAG